MYYDYLNVEEGVRNLFHPPSLRGEILLKLLSIETVVFPTQAHLSSPHHHPPGRFIRFLIQDSSTSLCRKPKSSFKVVPSSELLENQWNSQEYKINVQLKEGDVLGFIYDHVELNTSQFLTVKVEEVIQRSRNIDRDQEWANCPSKTRSEPSLSSNILNGAERRLRRSSAAAGKPSTISLQDGKKKAEILNMFPRGRKAQVDPGY